MAQRAQRIPELFFFSLYTQPGRALADMMGMTHPRIRPCRADEHGNPTTRSTLLITRTTSDRRFLLKPGHTVNKMFAYCLFAAAEKYGAELHAIVVLSNHVHIHLTIDPDKLSDFNAWLNRHVAMCLIEHYGKLYPKRTLEAVWSKDPPHELILANEAAILEKLVYLMANPEAAHLVHDYKKWPGFRSTPRDWLRGDKHLTTYKRPNLYFSDTGRAPEEVTSKFTIPLAFAHWDKVEFVEKVEELLNTERARLRALNPDNIYLGAEAAMAVDPFDSPNSRRPRYGRTPIVACGGDQALMREAKKAINFIRRTYRAAWNEFKELGTAIFPAGTFKMRTRFHMPCAEGCFDWCLLTPG